MSQNQNSLKHTLAVVLPCVFTVGRIICGYYAVMSAFRGMSLIDGTSGLAPDPGPFENAAKAIALGVLFDILDGKVARLVGSASRFGREFDSLADVVTFGMAPAILCFVWGVMPILPNLPAQSARVLNVAGWFAACTFLVCGALRLARFNLGDEPTDTKHRHFDGLPIPAGAAVIASIVYFVKLPSIDIKYGIAWLVLVVILALLMISRLRYAPPFGVVTVFMRHPLVLFCFVCLLLWALWVHSNYVFLVLALSYAISGPITHIVFRLRPALN